MKRFLFTILFSLFIAAFLAAESSAISNPFSSKDKKAKVEKKLTLEEASSETLGTFKDNYPGMKKFFDTAYGYAVFPHVRKAGLLVGGSRGRGVLYEQGELVGNSTLTQMTVGLQIGSQAYSEILFIKKKSDLDDFKDGFFTLGAQAKAMSLSEGVSPDARYSRGVAIFISVKGGLMYETSVGGQRFTFEPKSKPEEPVAGE